MNECDLFTALRLIVKICKDVKMFYRSGIWGRKRGLATVLMGEEMRLKEMRKRKNWKLDKTISCVVALLLYLLYLRPSHLDIMIKQKGERIGQALAPFNPSTIHL